MFEEFAGWKSLLHMKNTCRKLSKKNKHKFKHLTFTCGGSNKIKWF